ncbi:PHD finger protein enhancer of yellow 3 isoform X2 [Anticarsia gemmatalis]|uniref:PHD finger protein enhancer of yellow 3 isoform X2 n=1 Tax=Anticarsia gemmatalis TaxID=129554 RepID=UPI003F76A4F0
MESSEDDAGTATNASRRASAREKDVGLAEDVNATSSFQQKSSEARLSCQTPAMSEDNFDGDSVPSPSSQDVNTSTEAILDMIDEIVDGPDAPKRLPLTSEYVDALNEEFATTSYNLNIIQESAKSDGENVLPSQSASPVNNAESETPLPAKADAPAECSTHSDKPAEIVNTGSVDLLPASSSLPESDVKAASPEDSVVANVVPETSTSCPPPNTPSSSEVHTVQNLSDISVCEPQDRTVKCVTSSDNRDNVTVESAESTSSDSSVSESKTLLVEPQVRSPLRRRLVRPAPSDRRPDSTVSSTVDSQNVNIPTTEHISSENITKDVTSSSDAVPTIHGNVKPEEIRNVSEISFCQAETSVSPPKKIKLIRQKNITGTSNIEIPFIQTSVLTEKEQCQSTSSDNLSLHLPIPTIESTNAVSLLQTQENNESSTLDSNCLPDKIIEPPIDSAEKIGSDQHSQPSIEHKLQQSSTRSSLPDDERAVGKLPSMCPQNLPQSPIEAEVKPCDTHQALSSLLTSHAAEQHQTPDLKDTYLEQGTVCNANSEHTEINSLDDGQKRPSCPLSCTNEEPKSGDSRENEIQVNTAVDSNTRLLEVSRNQLESSSSSLTSQSIQFQLGDSELDSKITETELNESESKSHSSSSELNTLTESKQNLIYTTPEPESKSTDIECDKFSNSGTSELKDNESIVTHSETEGRNSMLVESNKSEKTYNEPVSLTVESQSETTDPTNLSVEPELRKSPLSKSIEPEQNIEQLPSNIGPSKNIELVPVNVEPECKQSEPSCTSIQSELKINECVSPNVEPETKSVEPQSISVHTGSEIESNEPQSITIESGLKSSKSVPASVEPEQDSNKAHTMHIDCEDKGSGPVPASIGPEQENNKPYATNIQCEVKSSKPLPASDEPEQEITEPHKVNIECAVERSEPVPASIEPEQEINKPQTMNIESADKSTEPVSASIEPEQEINEPHKMVIECTVKSSESVLAKVEPEQETNKPYTMDMECEVKSSEPVLASIEPEQEINKPQTMNIECAVKSTEPVPANIEPEQEITEPHTMNIESAVKSTEPVPASIEPEQEITEPHTMNIESAVKSTEPVTASIEPEQEITEPHTMNIESEVKSSEPVSASIESQQENNKHTTIIQCELKSSESVPAKVEPEQEINLPQTMNIECEVKNSESVSTSVEPKQESNEPHTSDIECAVKSSEPVPASIEPEQEITEPHSVNIEHKLKTNEAVSISVEPETKNNLHGSTSTELQSARNEPVAVSNQQSLTSNEHVSMTIEPELKNKEIFPMDVEPVLESNQLVSLNICNEVNCSDSVSLSSDSKSQDQSREMVKCSDASLLKTDCELKSRKHESTVTESETTATLKSEDEKLITSSSNQESKSDLQSNRNKQINEIESVEHNLIESHIESKATFIESESTTYKSNKKEHEVKEPKIKTNEPESSSIDLKSRSSKPESMSVQQVSEQESESSQPESTSTELESGNNAIEAMSTEHEPEHIKVESCLPEPAKSDTSNEHPQEDQKKVPPIKLNLSRTSMSSQSESKLEVGLSSINKSNATPEESDSTKQVPKLTIKLKQPESPVPKVTIKPIRPPDDEMDNVQQVPCITKLNIKPILKPVENVNDKSMKAQLDSDNKDTKQGTSEQLPCITKLNIKPILKPPEKINDIHRKSSSSEISESECSENDETTSTSDQASASDHGSSDVVPKVTIKLGKPGTESEGKFYTEKNVPKLTIKGIQQDEKLIISQSDDTQPEKVPKLTIKTVTKTEGQPLSPKLTIKPLKPPDNLNKEGEIPKLKISTESYSTTESKESPHVPKITIKPVTKMDAEPRTPKKSTALCDSPEHIPVVTKLNIKPILKPIDSGESSEGFDDTVPVISKLNIKPVIKPKDNDVDSSVDDVPKITKLNIKPLKNPEDNSSEEKDCDELNADIEENSIPVVTKINIKPIVKPQQEEKEKDSENLSSETGNSSDDNTDHIPVVTKLNIKPIIKPDELQESSKSISSNEPSIPIVTKLNIKPLVKPGESSPSSPKKEHSKIDVHSTNIPVVTKLNIKPVLRPEEADSQRSKDDNEEKSTKNPPLVMKINMKSVTENYNHESSHNEHTSNYVSDGLLSIAPKMTKTSNEVQQSLANKEHRSCEPDSVNVGLESKIIAHSPVEKSLKQNCVPESFQKNEENDDRYAANKKSSLNTMIKKPKLCDGAQEKQHSPKMATVTKCDSIYASSALYDASVTKESKVGVTNETHSNPEHKNINYRSIDSTESAVKQPFSKQKVSSVQNCTLLKKLLENTRDSMDKSLELSHVRNCADRSESTSQNVNRESIVESGLEKTTSRNIEGSIDRKRTLTPDKLNDLNITETKKSHSIQELSEKVNESVTKPLEITISDKITNQSSGQDSPRIILKINKTDHGPSAKIITEDVKRPDTLQHYAENTQDNVNDKQSPKRHIANSRRKQTADTTLNLSTGKRLRSSRIVENTEKSQVKRNIGKRPSNTETTPSPNKESELSILQSKRLKLGQLLSSQSNKSLNISPVSPSQTSPTKTNLESKPAVKTVNHSLLNNENCSKNGNSKLHNILSNLQAKQMQTLSYNNMNCSEKTPTVSSDTECNASMSSSDTTDIPPVENSHPELQQMIINENSDFRDLTGPEDTSQDPLEVDSVKPTEVIPEVVDIPKPVELTPQPKKRGRPRKLPVSEGAKPAVVTLPVPALEERPQRSLRLMRDRPTILLKPRGGRGRGRGGRRSAATPPAEPEPVTITEPSPEEQTDERPTVDIDPMSSRIKLPRMTEALDKMPSVCTTPLSSRRRNSSGTFSSGEASELKVALENSPSKVDEFPKSPEPGGSGRGRGGRGSRGGRGRTPRGRGRGRGGGRGAMYMKETMGIYGRVCGPATTTVQLFEEETCMMDDNATPAKPSHLLDEDSQSSVKSSTNESSKMKKSKFADLFDSNKVWTAADVKEYTWPPPDKADGEQKVMMIQEQVAMFLGVKSFKRRYPELKRRTIGGEERDFVLSKGLVTEALCDLGITAVDASEVLDIMLSDYPHKYEEFRSYQRTRQLTEAPEEPAEEPKPEEKPTKADAKPERPVESKPELPKVDPEKTRQDMAAAAIASASEWNTRANALRRGACADLQSLTVLRPRPAPAAPRRAHLRPPAGFYPHALLPGQYQHSYRVYTPDQLRYFPLNTALAAPPAPVSTTDWSSESEPDWGSRCSSSDDSDAPTHHSAKRKKLTKVKRSSQPEAPSGAGAGGGRDELRDEPVDTCRVCHLRLEANRKYTHERFLVCANCNAKLHPSCLDLSADTIRKCREYAWQCPECKTCCSCRQSADDDNMLFCDLCDRGFHIYCVGLDTVPTGRWHCVECAICKSCGARSPGGPEGAAGPAPAAPADWHHQTRRGPGGHKVYSHSLCTPCARVR